MPSNDFAARSRRHEVISMGQLQKVHEFELRVTQQDAYRFEVSFDKDYDAIAMDEPPPLGEDSAPNAVRILGAAIGNCLAASLVFCLGKRGAKIAHGVEARVHLEIVRNEDRRLRVGHVRVHLKVPPDVAPEALEACRGSFEDFCTVTSSVRHGIDVEVVLESP
jgi:uncharacterized OsmC-like protein